MKRHHTGHPRGGKHKAGMGKAHGKGARDKVAGLGQLGKKMKAHAGRGTKPSHPSEAAFDKTMTGLAGSGSAHSSPYKQQSYADNKQRAKRMKRLEDVPI